MHLFCQADFLAKEFIPNSPKFSKSLFSFLSLVGDALFLPGLSFLSDGDLVYASFFGYFSTAGCLCEACTFFFRSFLGLPDDPAVGLTEPPLARLTPFSSAKT
jgi:hypothetical protein